jgi:hypothetical protein
VGKEGGGNGYQQYIKTSGNFPKSISNANIPRKPAGLITQLFTAHIQYFNRFKRINSAQCPACGVRAETVEHYLLHSPGYAYDELGKGTSAEPSPLAIRLGDPDFIIPLANHRCIPLHITPENNNCL